jgi:hypothetical protein
MYGRILAVLLVMSAFATACGGSTSPSGPSEVRVDTPGTATITVSGTVRDASTNGALAGADVRVTDGPDATRSATTDASGNYALTGLRVGRFTVRFSREGFEVVERPLNVLADTRVDVHLRAGGSCAAPQPPTGFRATVAGTRVSFVWTAAAGATQYVLVVGSAPGSSNTLSVNTTQTTYTWRGAPIGTHYARVFARSDCVHDSVSTEITFTTTGG